MNEIFDRNDIETPERVPSVAKRGAEDGLRLGAVMSVMVLAFLLSTRIPLLLLLAPVLFVLVPLFAYRMMRRDYLLYPSMRFFSALWMHGICMFFFGSMLMAVCMYVYLHFIDPDYILRNLNAAIVLYRQTGLADGERIADAFQMLIDRHEVPSAINLSVTMIWLVSFTGSLLSMVLSWLVRILNSSKN